MDDFVGGHRIVICLWAWNPSSGIVKVVNFIGIDLRGQRYPMFVAAPTEVRPFIFGEARFAKAPGHCKDHLRVEMS